MLFLKTFVLVLAMAGMSGAASPVVAEVNGEVITRHDVEMMVSVVFKQLEARYEEEVLEEKKRGHLKRVVDFLIEQKLLVQAARERGIEVDEEDVDSRMEALAERVGGWPVLLNMFAKVGISFEERARQVREELMVRRLLSFKVRPKVYSSPSDAWRGYLWANP